MIDWAVILLKISNYLNPIYSVNKNCLIETSNGNEYFLKKHCVKRIPSSWRDIVYVYRGRLSARAFYDARRSQGRGEAVVASSHRAFVQRWNIRLWRVLLLLSYNELSSPTLKKMTKKDWWEIYSAFHFSSSGNTS